MPATPPGGDDVEQETDLPTGEDALALPLAELEDLLDPEPLLRPVDRRILTAAYREGQDAFRTAVGGSAPARAVTWPAGGTRTPDLRSPCAGRCKRRGARFRFQRRLAPCTADLVLTGRHLAVFVDGCWWHSCPQHGRQTPFTGPNAALWERKLARTRQRDRDAVDTAEALGWQGV